MDKGTPLAVSRFPVIPELDGLRGWGMFVVFFCHIHLSNGKPLGAYLPGGLAITMFFFLSGFLITSLMRLEFAKTGTVNFKTFYYRRILRIFPPFYLALAVGGVLVATGLITAEVDAKSILAQALYFSNYAKILGWTNGIPGPPLWSLAVEEHYYMLFPFLFFFVLVRMRNRNAFWLCIAACILPLIFRLMNSGTPDGLELNYFLTHTRLDAILPGCALALWQNPILDGKKAWKPGIPLVIFAWVIILAASAYRNPFFADTFRYSFQAVGMFILFSWVLHGSAFARLFLARPMIVTLGRWSYTIYLVHGMALLLVEQHLPQAGFVLTALVAGSGTLAYAWASYNYMEMPLARRRQKTHNALSESPDLVHKPAAPEAAPDGPATPAQDAGGRATAS